MSKTAVLFLTYRRFSTSALVFKAIRDARPPRLYFASNAPNLANEGERQRVEEVRSLLNLVDWQCEVYTLFRDEYLPVKSSISSAIDWFFDHEEEGIILEDDCVPDLSYFRYAQELLARYRDDKRVMVISGDHFHGAAHQPPYSYFFSRYNHCWGWASWRRAWQLYDRDMSLWPELRDTDWLLGVGSGSRPFQRYWTDIFDSAYAGKVDTWDYQWTFSCWAQHGLTILPARHLVTNIGFGEGATHTKGNNILEAELNRESLDFPLTHPPVMVRDVVADKWSDCHVFGISKLASLKNTVRKMPGVQTLVKNLRKLEKLTGHT
jgi:hypothetical protein